MSSSLFPLPALMVGLLGNVHCFGMCGGLSSAFALAMPQATQSHRKHLYHLVYNMGRLSTYALFGCIAGSIGQLLSFTLGFYGILLLRIIAGLIIISLGLYITGWWRGLSQLEQKGASLWRRISPFTKKLMPVKSPAHAYLLGMIWGFLPCGLVYSTLSLSVVSGKPLAGALTMLFFGIGTLPSMLGLGVFTNQIGYLLRHEKIQRYAGASVIFCGFWTMGGMVLMRYFMSMHH